MVMEQNTFEVIGGHSLKGTLTPQGAKNEALQVLSAILLTPEEVTISNLPNILDVQKMIDLLKGLGVKVQKIDSNTYTFEAKDINLDYLTAPKFQSDAKRIRGSVMLIGPMLARFKKAFLPKPGGDKIGRRRLDTHFIGLQKLNGRLEYDQKK